MLANTDYKESVRLGHDGYPFTLDVTITSGENTTAPYLDTNLEECKATRELSICGTYRGSGGQNKEEFLECFKGDVEAERLYEIWSTFHLNGMNPGTTAQQEVIDEYRKVHAEEHKSYENACKILEKYNILEDRGYKYGSAWLTKTLPKGLVEEVIGLVEVLEKRYGEQEMTDIVSLCENVEIESTPRGHGECGESLWTVTLTYNGEVSDDIKYSMGSALKGKPDVKDVVFNIVSDASYGEYETFEEFCDNLGYDSDSRKAESIYNACKGTVSMIERLFGDDLEKFQEAAQDY